MILSWLFGAKIFLFLLCFDRWRQLRSQATTEICGRLFPAFRWSLFTKRKINIHSGNLSSFLQRAQMCLEVIWRRSLYAHLLSQQMLLQSCGAVNQQNVLLFPDFPFLMMKQHCRSSSGKKRIHGERHVQPDSCILPLCLTNGPWASVSTWIALLEKKNVPSDNPGLRQIHATANYF